MASFNGLWLPMSNSTSGTPAEGDFNKVANSQLVQSARQDRTFVSRLMTNASPLFSANGAVAKSANFTVTGAIGTQTHLKNDRFSGMNRNQIQRTINLDERPRITTIEEESITRMFEQVNVRSDILSSMGYALASWDEVEALKALVDASATGAIGSENQTEFLTGGGTIAVGDTETALGALAVLDALETTAVAWGKKMVPNNGRHCIVAPETYWEILKLEKAYTGATAIQGGIYGNLDIAGDKAAFSDVVNSEMPLNYRGFQIWQHNLMAADYDIHLTGLRAQHTADTNHNSRGMTYNTGNLAGVEAIVFQQEAVGKADVMSVMFEQDKVPMSTNEYINAMTWVGYGTLNPQSAVALITTA